MKKLSGVIIIFILFVSCSKKEVAYDKNVDFKFYSQSNFSEVRKAIFTANNEVVFVGQSNDAPSILIMDQNFSKRTQNTLSKFTTGNFNDVIETSDGNLLTAGFTTERLDHLNENRIQNLSLLFNKNGKLIDSMVISSGAFSQFHAVEEGNDGNYIYGGELNNLQADIFSFTFKDSSFFYKLYPFDKPLANAKESRVLDVCKTSNDEFFFSGFWSKSLFEFANFTLLAKTTNNSFEVINYFQDDTEFRSINSHVFFNNLNSTIVEVNDGFLVGSFFTDTGRLSMELVKMSPNNQFMWKKKYYGLGNAIFNNMIEVDNGVLLIGKTFASNYTLNSSYSFAYVIKVDLSGNIVWEHTFGSDEQANNALIAKQEGNRILVAGTFARPANNISFIKYELDLNGKLIMRN